MKLRIVTRILLFVLTITLFTTFVFAAAGKQAPSIATRTLDGGTFTNASLRGRITLLQIWATWCPYCRRDQAAVDRLERMYSSEGLQVLAIDTGESETKVRNYLRENPRSCRIALDEDKSTSASFGSHGLPYYVLIDEAGKILGTQNGSGGEESLQELLSRAGLSNGPGRSRRANQEQTAPGKARVIEAPRVEREIPPRPNPKTIFVLATGVRLELAAYKIEAGVLHTTVDGQQRSIPLSTLNMNATTAANRERGIELKLPASRSEVLLSF
jgi:thiol-disulfide isomerase/thioredoxin